MIRVRLTTAPGAGSRFVRIIDDRFRLPLRYSLTRLVQDVQRRWQRGTRSSRMRRNIRVHLRGPNHYEVAVYDRDIGFPAVVEEVRTRPHVIRPRKAKMLRFVARSGDIVFTNRVNHPGSPGSKALRRAVRDALRLHRRRLRRLRSA